MLGYGRLFRWNCFWMGDELSGMLDVEMVNGLMYKICDSFHLKENERIQNPFCSGNLTVP